MCRNRISLAALVLLFGIGTIAPTSADSPQALPGLNESIKELAKSARPQDVEAATADMQYQSAMCTAYYTLAYVEAVNTGESDAELSRMKFIKDQSLTLTVDLATSLKMSMAALKSQMKLNMETLNDAMNHNWNNVAVIVDKYGMPCKAFMEAPLKNWAHWLQVEKKKGGHTNEQN